MLIRIKSRVFARLLRSTRHHQHSRDSFFVQKACMKCYFSRAKSNENESEIWNCGLLSVRHEEREEKKNWRKHFFLSSNEFKLEILLTLFAIPRPPSCSPWQSWTHRRKLGQAFCSATITGWDHAKDVSRSTRRSMWHYPTDLSDSWNQICSTTLRHSVWITELCTQNTGRPGRLK